MSQGNWTELSQLLQQASETTSQLLILLTAERESLQQRDYEQYEQLLKNKEQLIHALECATKARRRWQAQQGLADDSAALAAAEAAAPAIAAQWQELAAQWQQCQQASLINEKVAQRTRQVVGRVLDILSGNAGLGGTYDAAGTARRANTGRNITTA